MATVDGGDAGKSLPGPKVVGVCKDNEYFEARQIPGKGYGCVAKQDISCGTRILVDEPLLTIPNGNYSYDDVEDAFQELTPEQKELYMSLTTGLSPDGEQDDWGGTAANPSACRIFQINCMEWNNGAAVFPNAARFNHSCVPNANFSWHPELKREVIHATRNIRKGEEITVTYIGMTGDMALRMWLLDHYGFRCECPACTSSESADRRFRIDELQNTIKPYRGHNLDVRNTVVTSQMLQLVMLCKQEGEYTTRLAHLLLELAMLCERTGDWQHGLEYAASAVKMRRDCQGVDFPGYSKYTEVLTRIHEKMSAAAAAGSGRGEA